MKYYENGNLYQYPDHSNGRILSWHDIINMLWGIAGGLKKIHRNFHGGNLLIEDETDARICDIGLYGPCHNLENKGSNQIYGAYRF